MDYVASTDHDPANEAEYLLLTEAPGVQATRQRSAIFTEVLSALVTRQTVALAAGCGYMDELLRIPAAADAEALIGVDLDPAAIEGAALTAHSMQPQPNCLLAVGDAWDIPGAQVALGDADEYLRLVTGHVDVLTSNGLNIYVADDHLTTDLYRSFARTLRPGGTLVVSAITPPETWLYDGISREATRRISGLMYLCDVMWSHFRSEQTTTEQLGEAGFDVKEVRWDCRRAYPTFVATARTTKGH